MDDIEIKTFCFLCIEEEKSGRLVRLAWSGNQIVVPAVADDEKDFYICENCIRCVKRLSFRAIANSVPAAEFFVARDPEEEDDEGGDPIPPCDYDIPF